MVQEGFNEFPDLAHNDFTVDQMNSIHAAQDNLNGNTENDKLAEAFISEVQTTAERLRDEYKDYWKSPFAQQKWSEWSIIVDWV